MRHGLMKVMFGKGLCVVRSKRWNECDNHLSHVRISVGLEVQDLLGSIKECIPHELIHGMHILAIQAVRVFEYCAHHSTMKK